MNTRISQLVFGLLATAAVIGGCERTEDPNGSSGSGNVGTPAPDADNTARNARDGDTNTKTPLDQGQSSSDVTITAEIRRAIMGDKGMSVQAQNIKIITEKGVVTLRGQVDTQAEKDSIEAKAKAVAGVISVDNQLEVKTG